MKRSPLWFTTSLFLSSFIGIAALPPASPPLRTLRDADPIAQQGSRHTKVIQAEEAPGGMALPLGRGYYLVYSEDKVVPTIDTKTLTVSYTADLPERAPLAGELAAMAKSPDHTERLVPVLYRYFDAEPVRNALTAKHASLPWAALLQAESESAILARGGAVVRVGDLESFAAIDGMVWVESAALGIQTLGESAILITANETEWESYRHSMGEILIDATLETPRFISFGGKSYLTFLEERMAALFPHGENFFAVPSAYPVVTVIDDGLDNGVPRAPALEEFYFGGEKTGTRGRTLGGFEWYYDSDTELPLPSEGFPFADLIPLETPTANTYHGSAVAQFIAAHPRADGESRDAVTGFFLSHGVSPHGRLASANLNELPFPEGVDHWPTDENGDWLFDPEGDNSEKNFHRLLHPGDIIRIAGEIHRRNYYYDMAPENLEGTAELSENHAGITALQTAIINNSYLILRFPRPDDIPTPQRFHRVSYEYGLYHEVYDKLTRDSRPAAWYRPSDPYDGVNTRAQSLFIAAAGNSNNEQLGMDTIAIPGAAKNALTVGGSDPFRNAAVEPEVLEDADRRFPLAHIDANGNVEEILLAQSVLVFRTIPMFREKFHLVIDLTPEFDPQNPQTTSDIAESIQVGEEYGAYLGAQIDWNPTFTEFTITVSLEENPSGIEPNIATFTTLLFQQEPVTHYTFTELRAPTDTPTPTAMDGQIASIKIRDWENTSSTPDLFTIKGTRVADTPTTALIVLSADPRFRSANDLWGGASRGIDLSAITEIDSNPNFDPMVGPPVKRVKPDVIGPAGRLSVREYPAGSYGLTDGTSYATGMTSGLAQLAYFILENRYARSNISPALLKAYVVNTAEPISGLRTGPAPGETWRLPSPWQGFGRISVEYATRNLERFLVDQTLVFTTEQGSVNEALYVGRAANPDEPVRVTLVWTDAPAVPGYTVHWEELVNDLDLIVQIQRPGGSQQDTFHYFAGNNFSTDKERLAESVEYPLDGETYPGNPDDPWEDVHPDYHDRHNNVESITIPPQPPGTIFRIGVRAHALEADALDPWAEAPPTVNRQDFALVASNFDHRDYYHGMVAALLGKIESSVYFDSNLDGIFDTADLVHEANLFGIPPLGQLSGELAGGGGESSLLSEPEFPPINYPFGSTQNETEY